MVVVFVAVLERFGVQTTSFIAVLGAAGLALNRHWRPAILDVQRKI
jgi:small-conductance mechanosensitive channel